MIQKLSEELISQIAAGEVIERPASAIKELLENSIDAGASQITIEVEEAGMKKIRVIDDGCGISFKEAPLAFERHATSKIKSLEDLFTISSLGFRGEALASLASIAEVELKSKQPQERLGVFYFADGTKVLNHEEIACPNGTDITIRSLFKHTPARRKYMKSEQSEYGHLLHMLSQIALAHSHIRFKFIKDGKEIFNLPKQSTQERIRGLYGNEIANGLLPVQFHQSNLLIQGFVGKPELARSSKKYQFIFLNGRPIESRTLNHAVKEAFHSLLMHEKYPWFLLDINIDPAFVDINVHPRKLEVKFVNQQEVYRAVKGAVFHALENQILNPKISGTSAHIPSTYILASTQLNFRPLFQQRDLSSSQENSNQIFSENTFQLNGTELRPIAQIANSYIVAESEEGMVLIDQHASHERVRYAKLMTALEKSENLKQALLTPIEMDFGIESSQLLEENLADFEAMGFEIEAFGGSTFLLRSVPAGLEKRNPEQILREILMDVSEDQKKNHTKNLKEVLLTSTACRGAIKFGDRLTMPEMQALIRDMEQTKNCTHCPHGRPALITLTFDGLETMFKRKNF